MSDNVMGNPSSYTLDNHGLRNLNMVYWTLPSSMLMERVISRREGVIAHEGAIVIRTGNHTGRAPNDKFIVKDGPEADEVWWGDVNRAMSPEKFERLYLRMTAYFQGRDVFVQDAIAGSDPKYQLPIRVITENAVHSLFSRNMFLRCSIDDCREHKPEFTVLHAPGFRSIPEIDGTNSDIFIILNLAKRIVLIGGTSYAGEIKKSIFTVMNYYLPKRGVLPMHCSANQGENGDVALFFGLSGTGKTTLSSTPERKMIGDDEHGWAEDGVFNFEGGCYAKVIRLREDLEPVIWNATHRFGTILENVNIDAHTRRIDFDDASFTENTRAAYPLGYVENRIRNGRGGHPKNVFFLTADAFGILPPISRLTPKQAAYYFLSGYTSKLAGTERGLGSEPQATFSACFGAPFLPMHPKVYADLLIEKLRDHGSNVWLVNTGWTGGPYGVGERIHLPYTRAMVNAALNGELVDVPYRQDDFFGLSVPETCPGVPDGVLNPRATWEDASKYDQQAELLVERFKKNFERFASEISADITSAGPGD